MRLQCRSHRRHGCDPWSWKMPWKRAQQPTPVFLPGESHGQRSLAGYSPYGCKESDKTGVTWHAHTTTWKSERFVYFILFSFMVLTLLWRRGTLLSHKEVDINTWALTYGECLGPDTFCSKQKLSEVRRTVGKKEISGNINSQDLCHQLLRCITFLCVIYHSLEGNKMRVSKINDVWIGGKPGVRCYVICSRNVCTHTYPSDESKTSGVKVFK